MLYFTAGTVLPRVARDCQSIHFFPQKPSSNNSYLLQSCVHSSIHQCLYSLFFSFVIFLTLTVRLLGRVTSPSQGRYLHTEQHKDRKNAHTDIHALSGIRTHDPSVRASEDRSCLRSRVHRDRLSHVYMPIMLKTSCDFRMWSLVSPEDDEVSWIWGFHSGEYYDEPLSPGIWHRVQQNFVARFMLAYFSALGMETVRSSEMSVNFIGVHGVTSQRILEYRIKSY
jgi:hypothetical protein